MHRACEMGHLSVCKWLLKKGATELITKRTAAGWTPMLFACAYGQLSVCKWLLEVGEAADIFNRSNFGTTPAFAAFEQGHLSICSWLVFNGAFNRRPATEDDAQHDEAIGHVDQAIVKCETRSDDTHNKRSELLAWAQDVVATHHTFLHVVLRASVVLPESHQQISPDDRCHLPRLPRGVLERVGSMMDVEMGRRLRNVREFAEALVNVMDEEAGEEFNEDEYEEADEDEAEEDVGDY
jgi:hypothetical protein